MNNISGFKNTFDGDIHSGESHFMCSEQMDIPESIDIITNVMSPIVFWNMIVSEVVVSWIGQGFTMMVVLPW